MRPQVVYSLRVTANGWEPLNEDQRFRLISRGIDGFVTLGAPVSLPSL